MTYQRHLIFIYLILIVHQIQSLESSLNCWRCEVTIQSSEQIGAFLDDCQAQFDFTQHTRENCDGKCWKSVDLIDWKRWNNNNNSWHNHSWLSLMSTFRMNLKASRRCFSANELIRAAEMGVNTSDGCRQVQRENKKTKEICFCSDQDMCNKAYKIDKHFFLLFITGFILMIFSK